MLRSLPSYSVKECYCYCGIGSELQTAETRVDNISFSERICGHGCAASLADPGAS